MSLSGISSQNILYGCLDWGHGHVFRSIPIIRRLIRQANNVMIFCSSRQEKVFRHYLHDDVAYYVGFEQDFRFSGSGNFPYEMWRNRSHFFSARKNEARQVDELVSTLGVDLVISDHRYGLVSERAHSIFLTHQFRLPAGTFANVLHRKWMAKFAETFILDNADSGLAGKLSRGGESAQYIGWHSRFEHTPATTDHELIVAVLSGPDVYTGQLLRKIDELKADHPGKWKIISVSPTLAGISPGIVSDLSEADELIATAGKIVSRSGYTTLMDLEFLGKPAILIPTNGQAEQEYLAILQEERSDRVVVRI